MTYSIVARDPETGELGVAVQTASFGVGAWVPWAEPGVGGVATQSFTELSYGPKGLALMREGRTPQEALDELLAADAASALRQVAFLDATGRVAAFTGDRCVPAAGHATGDGVSAQANMMERDTVWGAMLQAYRAAEGPLAARLLAALDAAQAEGGDLRGRQSAAVIVVAGSRDVAPWEHSLDVRVDDHPEPLQELRRLLGVGQAYREMYAANDLVAAGDFGGAAVHSERSLALAPEDHQVAFWAGLVLSGAGRTDEAKALLDGAAAAHPQWAPYLRRLPASGLMPDMPQLFDALLPMPPSEEGS